MCTLSLYENFATLPRIQKKKTIELKFMSHIKKNIFLDDQLKFCINYVKL